MGKVVVALPMYRQVSVPWFFQFLQMEHEAVAGHVCTDGIYLPMAMEKLVDMAFEKFGDDWDRMVIYEHDMLPPLNGLTLIANYPDEWDIVGSVYHKHEWPHHVMAWMQVQEPYFSPLTAGALKAMVDTPALYDVHGVAMGFTSIHRRVFEKWDPKVPMWTPTPPLIGHDLHFCNEARKQGFRIGLDTGIGCGHLTMMPVGYADSQEALAQAQPPTWAGKESIEGLACYLPDA